MTDTINAGATSDFRWRNVLVVVLAVNSGAIDALGYLALGGAFTSVMTGNLVLLGLSGARHDGAAAAHAGAAILFFVVGCAVGARLVGPARAEQPAWPRAVNRGFFVQAVLTVGFAFGWWSDHAHPGGRIQLALLAINAVSLGIQSTTVQRFGVSGLSTTYLTGTLTTLVGRLAQGRRLREVGHSGLLLLGLIGGALASGMLVLHAPWMAPMLPLFCIGSVVLASQLRNRKPQVAPAVQ